MDRNEEGNSSATYRISSPTNADGAKRSPEKPNASALRKNSSGKLQNPNSSKHGLRTPGEEIGFTAWPKIKSQSQIYRYDRSIFCLPHQPKISGFFDLCLHWVFAVRAFCMYLIDVGYNTLHWLKTKDFPAFWVALVARKSLLKTA